MDLYVSIEHNYLNSSSFHFTIISIIIVFSIAFQKVKIGTISGDSPEIAVRNAFKTILTDEVAVRYSWTGVKKL